MEKVKNFFKYFDIFGAPVGLTYDGEATFQTCLGGFMALLAFFIVGASATDSFISLAKHDKYTISSQESIRPITDQLFNESYAIVMDP